MKTQRYYVDSFYDYWADPPIDYVIIGHATKQMEEHDGFNFVGGYDAADFAIYDSLEDAIKHSDYWPGSIQYEGDFNDIEREIIVNTTNKLISDTDFCKKFERNTDSVLFTDNDIKSANNHVSSIP